VGLCRCHLRRCPTLFRPHAWQMAFLGYFANESWCVLWLVSDFCVSHLWLGRICEWQPSSTEMRDVNCIRKQHSRYLYVEAWPGSDEIAIINTPPVIYHRVHPPAVVRLQIARGALGIEWLQGVSLPDSH
jgi:hypothetical protein